MLTGIIPNVSRAVRTLVAGPMCRQHLPPDRRRFTRDNEHLPTAWTEPGTQSHRTGKPDSIAIKGLRLQNRARTILLTEAPGYEVFSFLSEGIAEDLVRPAEFNEPTQKHKRRFVGKASNKPKGVRGNDDCATMFQR